MEFDLSLTPPANPQRINGGDKQAPMYASVEGRVASLSNNECVFQAREGGDLHVMTHQVLQAMDHCREFRSLDEHVSRVAAVLPGLSGQTGAVRHVLSNLIERGVLISDAQFLSRLDASGQADQSAVADVAAMVIRACDRPQQLQRLLDSLQAHASQHGRSDAIVVLDDSRKGDSIKSHQAALQAYAKATGSKVRHLDAAGSKQALRGLEGAGPDSRVFLETMERSGNGSFSGGRSYNLALLLTAGRRLFLLDDDYVLPFHRVSHAVNGLEPLPATPFESHFHSGLNEVMQTGSALSEDGLELQANLVGHPLASGMAANGLDRDHLRGQALSRLSHLRGNARVLATYTGTRGASFTSSSLWLYRLGDASRQRFWADRDSYLRNIHADTMEYAPSRVIARRHGLFTPFMLDNSQLLPCTANTDRGEDGLFGIAASYVHPDSLTLHLPITIGHVQEGRRDRFERAVQPLTPGINRFLREWILNQAQPARSADPGERLAFLAAQLEDLAHSPVSTRIEVLEEYLRYVRADLIEHLQAQILSSPQAPVYWTADVRRIVEANGRALLDQAPPRLDEWPNDLDANGCADRLRAACLELAGAYRAWPALWQRAAELGDRLLQPS